LILALQGPELVREYFAQLYAHANVQRDPATGGRTMNAHFATRSLEADGSWRDLTECFNSSADVSPTGSQMPRLVGLGYASVLYRRLKSLHGMTRFSHHGDEIAWGTIGNASTAEGMFWEALNAIGVLRAPVVIVIYDDGYGISVPNELQLARPDISDLLAGFQRSPGSSEGFDLYTTAGWDYPHLLETFQEAAQIARQDHVPSVIHVTQLTQPLGHSTSGSHERYKPPERLDWEKANDCLKKFSAWIIEQGYADQTELQTINDQARQFVEDARQQAWDALQGPILKERQQISDLIQEALATLSPGHELVQIHDHLVKLPLPMRRDLDAVLHEALIALRKSPRVQPCSYGARNSKGTGGSVMLPICTASPANLC
jgi:TPP-dependent pyruvate/acetoin dehydrogenase alpha subunit